MKAASDTIWLIGTRENEVTGLSTKGLVEGAAAEMSLLLRAPSVMSSPGLGHSARCRKPVLGVWGWVTPVRFRLL